MSRSAGGEVTGPFVIEDGRARVARAGLGVGEVEAERGGVAARVDDLLKKLGRFVVAAVGVGAVGGVEIGDRRREGRKGKGKRRK